MNKKDAKIWKHVVGSVKGAYGETDFNKKIIKIDKSKHNKKFFKSTQTPKKDSSLLNTITHEQMHVDHPNMTEKAVRKQTRAKIKKMGRKLKAKLYNQYK